MAKLYFKYGAMGSSKTAQALMTKFNYEEKGKKVWLIKPSTDIRDGYNIVASRIGLKAYADVVKPEDNIYNMYVSLNKDSDAIIADECQFFTQAHVDELRKIVDEFNVPILCFGLRTDFLTHMFEGSRRLFEIADSITEIKTICSCGKKATVNARIDENSKIVTSGSQVLLGSNDRYEAMCYDCWIKRIESEKKK